MQICRNLTTNNYNTGAIDRLKYIVIHYTGNDGDTAYNNTQYFRTYRGASAHYFVDENEIWQSIEDKNVAWHCGANSYKHAYCRNANSIGIELCSRISNGVYYFKDETVKRATALTKYLMEKYNIPITNIVRHYDVTGKVCPAPFVNDGEAWQAFLNGLTVEKIEEEEPEMRYNTVAELPEYARATIQKLINKGLLQGDGAGLDLSLDMVRLLVINDRAGLYN